MYIKKIITYIILVILLYGGINYYYKDIGLVSNIVKKGKELSPKELIKSKNIKIMAFDLSKYNIEKNDYAGLYDYFSGLYKSSFIGINDKDILSFGISGNLSSEKKEKLEKKIIKILQNKDYKRESDIFHIKYTQPFLKQVLMGKFQYKIKSINNSTVDLFDIKEKSDETKILDKDLSKYFNVDTIKNLKIGERIIQDKTTPYAFKGVAGKQYPKLSLSEYIYKGKEYKQGYDITENSVPIIAIFKTKKQGTGLLIKEFNEVKEKEINNIYNIIDEIIVDNKKINLLTDEKGFSKTFNNILQFTEYTSEKYFDLYMKNKGNKIIKIDKNKMLLENDNGYMVLYFDKANKYKYNKKLFNPTGYVYTFETIKTVNTQPFLSKFVYEGLNKSLIKNKMSPVKGDIIKRTGNVLKK